MFPLSGQKEKIAAASRLSFIRAIGPVRREGERSKCYLLTFSVFVGFFFWGGGETGFCPVTVFSGWSGS